MQKTNIKASILIWSIFLSMIIIVTFVNISTQVNHNLKENDEYITLNSINNKIDEIIKKWKINWVYTDKFLENKDKLLFDNQNISIIWLKNQSTHLSKINNNSNIEIKVLEWWPITFKNESNSWIIISEYIFSSNNWDLEIENLSGYSRVQIKSNSFGDYLDQYLWYKVLRKIWNQEVIVKAWKIKNF